MYIPYTGKSLYLMEFVCQMNYEFKSL